MNPDNKNITKTAHNNSILIKDLISALKKYMIKCFLKKYMKNHFKLVSKIVNNEGFHQKIISFLLGRFSIKLPQ